MNKILRKIKQFFLIATVCMFKSKSAFIRIIKYEAENYLEDCCNSGTKQVEEMQDLLFHIDAYLNIPKELKITMFPEFTHKPGTFKPYNVNERFIEYLEEVEKQRSVERLFIFESLKHFPFDPVF